MNLTRLLLVIGLSLTLGACGSDDTVSVTDETGGTSSGGGGSSSGGDATSQERVLASDLAITDIAAYQSVRVGLVSNGAPSTTQLRLWLAEKTFSFEYSFSLKLDFKLAR